MTQSQSTDTVGEDTLFVSLPLIGDLTYREYDKSNGNGNDKSNGNGNKK